MVTAVLAAGLLIAGCPERALEVPEDIGVPFDHGVDFSTDFSTDLAMDLSQLKPNQCPAGTEFIYVIDENRNLSRFNPVTSQFFDVGFIDCPAPPAELPNSMAIDRDGNGWVNYSNGGLFRILTKTASCTGTPYIVGQQGFTRFGMSFAQNSAGSVDETLFVTPTGNSGGGFLSTINLKSFMLENTIPLFIQGDGELTGDDKGNLWGFFPDATPPVVARLDKTAGTVDRETFLPSLLGQPLAWGFAAFRNDFYIFLQRQNEASTFVYKLDGTTHDLTTVLSNTGRRIVGVGVATCAGDGLD